MKIAFYDTKSYDIPAFEKECAAHDVEIRFFDSKLNRDTARLAEGFDAVCVFVNDDVNREVIDILYDLGVHYILLRCAGYNNVDIEYCYKKIHVAHVPAYSPYAVAEHAMALLLTSIRRIHKAYNRIREFNFSLDGLTGFDLYGKTVGVIGTGKIGRVFVDICRGFHMNVLCYDPFPVQNADYHYVSLPELFENSDIISLHCPLTKDTAHMINAQSIEQMKKGVVILNTSRGGLIDSEALLEGIKERKIGAACLDVYEEEADIFYSDRSGHILNDDVLARLISMPNVIVTSHQAFLTQEALANIAETSVQNLVDLSSEGMSANELCYHCGNIENCRKQRHKKCF